MKKHYLIFILLALFGRLAAQTSPLDPNFGNNGVVLTDFTNGDTYGEAVAQQPDGKLLLSGLCYPYIRALTRFNTDGTLDTGFGTNGTAFCDFGHPGKLNDIVILFQPDSKIIIVMEAQLTNPTKTLFALARLNADGTPDAGFGTNGLVINDFGSTITSPNAAFLLTDGKIVVSGNAYDNVNHVFYPAIVRYHADGSTDSTFAGAGLLRADTLGVTKCGTMLRQPDGNMLLTGQIDTYPPTVGLIRIHPDGSADSGFGSGGLADIKIDGQIASKNQSIALQPDGKILYCGYIDGPNYTSNVGITRLLPNGTTDSSFASNGILKFLTGFSNDFANTIAVLADGKILIAGKTVTSQPNEPLVTKFFVAKLNLDGTVDASFGTNGLVTFGRYTGSSIGLLPQPDGKIIVSGTMEGDLNYSKVLYKLNADGSLDTGFNGDGHHAVALGNPLDDINSLAVASNGSILAAGFSNDNHKTIALAKYLPSGAPDTQLGGAGSLRFSIPDLHIDNNVLNQSVLPAVIQPDGKTILACISGAQTWASVLLRINPDGTLDSTFGQAGRVIDTLGTGDTYPFAMTLLPNGKIAYTGEALFGSGSYSAFVRQFNPDGTPDTTFNHTGLLAFDFGGGFACAMIALKAQADGKLIAGGRVRVYSVRQYALARINPNGTLDDTFGTDGKTTTSFGTTSTYSATIQALDIQTDGKIIAGGFGNEAGPLQRGITLARYNTNGSLDASFGSGGKVITDYSEGIETSSLALDSDGKIVVAGNLYNSTSFALLRYKTNGTLDSLVGDNGILLAQADTSAYEKSYALAIQPDGKILLGGYVYDGINQKFATIRFVGGSGLQLGTVDFSTAPSQMLIYPNPIRETATLEYNLPEATTVSLELSDLQGRLIQTSLTNASRTAAAHQEAVSLPETIPVGTYILSLTTPQGRISVKIMKRL